MWVPCCAHFGLRDSCERAINKVMFGEGLSGIRARLQRNSFMSVWRNLLASGPFLQMLWFQRRLRRRQPAGRQPLAPPGQPATTAAAGMARVRLSNCTAPYVPCSCVKARSHHLPVLRIAMLALRATLLHFRSHVNTDWCSRMCHNDCQSVGVLNLQQRRRPSGCGCRGRPARWQRRRCLRRRRSRPPPRRRRTPKVWCLRASALDIFTRTPFCRQKCDSPA